MKAVYAETVLVFGYDREQASPQGFELRVVHPALEDRVLDALAEILAGRGDPT